MKHLGIANMELGKDFNIISNHNVDYLNEVFYDEQGGLIVRSYNELKDIPQQHLSLFCTRNGLYSIPTTELIDFLKEEIGQDNLSSTIEIASGNGVYGRELGIVATDSYMQADASIQELYDSAGQSTVSYGPNVEKLDAMSAVKQYRPKIVLASWCTHKFISKEAWRGGNSLGVNERNLLSKVEKYIHIGNEKIHNKKPILNKPHRKIKEKWIMSRSQHDQNNVIYIWDNK